MTPHRLAAALDARAAQFRASADNPATRPETREAHRHYAQITAVIAQDLRSGVLEEEAQQ